MYLGILWNRIKVSLRAERKFFIKLLLYVFLVLWSVWYLFDVEGLLYKHLYGKPTDQVLKIWEKEWISNYTEPVYEFDFNGYTVKKAFRKKYALSGVLVYHDDNTTFWKRYFWNSGNEKGQIYNKIASHDLTIIWGKSALSENLEDLEVRHELNGAEYECKGRKCNISDNENNNFHIIPANKRLDKALSLLPRTRHVPIYIEGYLTDWYGVGEYKDLYFETALDSHTISKKKMGGKKTGLCYQLYLTKFIYDGYIFE